MKYSIVITIALALTFNSLIITAGTITDTYISGDILTATKMNNIKAAVNDNDNVTARNTTKIQTLEEATVRETVTVIESRTITPPGGINCLSVQCPDTHPILTGGGVDLPHIFAMQVILSTPEIFGQDPASMADGTYVNASKSWLGCAESFDETSDLFFTVSAICTNK